MRFLATLQHDVGLVVVLRGHLYVEGVIERLLLVKEPGCDKFLKRAPFWRKLKKAKKLGALSRECARAAKALSGIRNGFAHDLEREHLTTDDDRRMKRALSADLAAKARECVHGDPDHVVGGWTRAGIAAIHSDLQHAHIALLVDQQHAERVASAASAKT